MRGTKADRGKIVGSDRAGIPDVAGVLGLPAKPIIFLEEGLFFPRVSVSAKKKWVFFFSCFGGVFVLFGGFFVLGGVCCFSRVSAIFFEGSQFRRPTTPKRGIPPALPASTWMWKPRRNEDCKETDVRGNQDR